LKIIAEVGYIWAKFDLLPATRSIDRIGPKPQDL
jgi:hypothetical protein